MRDLCKRFALWLFPDLQETIYIPQNNFTKTLSAQVVMSRGRRMSRVEIKKRLAEHIARQLTEYIDIVRDSSTIGDRVVVGELRVLIRDEKGAYRE